MPFQYLPSQASSQMLECTNLGKNYMQRKKSVTLFSKLQLQVYPGEVCLITGKSGVGKSTLLTLTVKLLRLYFI